MDEIEIGRPETDLHTVEADLEHPGVDLERDSWLAFDGDRLVVYGLLWDESGGERIDIDIGKSGLWHLRNACLADRLWYSRGLDAARACGRSAGRPTITTAEIIGLGDQ